MKARFGIPEIIADLVKALLPTAGVARALARAGAAEMIRRSSGYAFGASVAKHLQTVITETPGGIEVQRRVGGALAVNAELTCSEIAGAVKAQVEAQVALEAARGTEGEDMARASRENAEAALEAAIAKLGRLA